MVYLSNCLVLSTGKNKSLWGCLDFVTSRVNSVTQSGTAVKTTTKLSLGEVENKTKCSTGGDGSHVDICFIFTTSP